MNFLKGNTILLRSPEPADIELIYHWENDTNLWHLSNTLAPYSLYDIEQHILSSQQDIGATKQARFLIDLRDTNRTVGIIDLFEIDLLNQRCGVGIIIKDNSDRRKGIASEALLLIKDYTKNILQLNQLYCNIEESNQASIQLFLKAGFIQNGIKKDWLRRGEKWENELFFQCFH